MTGACGFSRSSVRYRSPDCAAWSATTRSARLHQSSSGTPEKAIRRARASGLRAALAELALAPERVVAIGDAENDQAFLGTCGYGVAVANALDSLKATTAHVTRGEAGAGVREIIDWLITTDA